MRDGVGEVVVDREECGFGRVVFGVRRLEGNELDDRCANRRFLTIFSISLDIKKRFAIDL